jgi:hypothetical protein
MNAAIMLLEPATGTYHESRERTGNAAAPNELGQGREDGGVGGRWFF